MSAILQGRPLIAVYCPFERKSKHLNSTETCNKLCGRYFDGSGGEIRCRRCYKIFEFRLEDGNLITEKTSPESVVAAPIPRDENTLYKQTELPLDLAQTPPSTESK